MVSTSTIWAKRKSPRGDFVDRPGPIGVAWHSRPVAPRARLDLNLLFIEPGQYPRAASAEPLLAHPAAVAQRAGAERLAILADLNAAGSYERFGGVPGLPRTPPARPGATKTM